ncbi:unnamed protein product [Owenia fusiformis]|uniref:Potassium channel subfamily K member 1 n=1 Tax=Owenia fusiformis TaxID=6347 RepID=A0A8S4PCD4_OWEFU|nr:unnamed protein product [Owenia fusiformis]
MEFFSKNSLRLMIISFFFICYIVIGASILSAVEGPLEQHLKQHLKTVRKKFLTQFPCVPDAELENFIVEVIEANNRGVSAVANVTKDPNWSFGQSLFFACTILTTIGYGHVTPLSEGGKVFCIVYAAIGIPLTLIMLTAIVERCMIVTSKLLGWLNQRLGHSHTQFQIRLIHLTIIAFTLILFMFLVPAAILMTLEHEWDFLDAFYYCFISLTTIGLGDYIPGDQLHQQYRALYKVATTGYLLVGLVMMMLLLTTIYDIPELNLGLHFYMKKDEVDEEKVHLRSGEEPACKYTEQINKSYQGDSVTTPDSPKVQSKD